MRPACCYRRCGVVCLCVYVYVTGTNPAKRLNRSRCCLARGLGWALVTMHQMGVRIPPPEQNGQFWGLGINGQAQACLWLVYWRRRGILWNNLDLFFNLKCDIKISKGSGNYISPCKRFVQKVCSVTQMSIINFTDTVLLVSTNSQLVSLKLTRTLTLLTLLKPANPNRHCRSPTRCAFRTSDNTCGTHRADTLFIDKFFKIKCTLPAEMPTDVATKPTDSRQSESWRDCWIFQQFLRRKKLQVIQTGAGHQTMITFM